MAKLMSVANIAPLWKTYLNDEFKKPYMLKLSNFLKNERTNYEIYPSQEDVFKAFELTDLNEIKVVILGQDPYHGKDQAHGLAFSVNNNTQTPSLRNIFKEYADDLKLAHPTTTNLSQWAKQGVFLLNTTMTVRRGLANSHKNRGWEIFTDKVIQIISQHQSHVVFILWGGDAQKKSLFIDTDKHLIIKSPHPSPLSAYRGFFGSKPFSTANRFLKNNEIEPVNWNLI